MKDKPILFIKAQVPGHTRNLASGKVVQVRAYDRNDVLPHSPTDTGERMKMLAGRGDHNLHPDSAAAHMAIGPWGPHNPRVVGAKVGKHPPEWGEPPAGATHAWSYNYGKGPVTVWEKSSRHGRGYHDPESPQASPDGFNYRTAAHYVARRLHQAKHGPDKV